MPLPVIRLLTISVLVSVALPAAPAMAGWRDGYYYDDGGWGGDYYAPLPRRPMYDPQDYAPDDGDYQAPWAQRRAYAPRYRYEPAYGEVPDAGAAPARPPIPPRNVETALPDAPYAGPDRSGSGAPPKKPPAKPRLASIAPAARPAAVRIPLALPVPRPNLESMDFDSATPSIGSSPSKPSASQVQR
ncbi:hypothetical protein [Labrys monachus]|uniref:Uncharacterized protein n=1 Tax=Labrys monachus TaxID=217067 RepID=A0ABU0FHZ4_9HYPH|nr:hypothetical protein [Labrys monachus]MDQ0394131.1 hypothetical protein [Labrys monachus]